MALLVGESSDTEGCDQSELEGIEVVAPRSPLRLGWCLFGKGGGDEQLESDMSHLSGGGGAALWCCWMTKGVFLAVLVSLLLFTFLCCL